MTAPLAWHALWAWVRRHDTTLDLITVWMLWTVTGVLAVAMFVAWWHLRPTADQTRIGSSLKHQKLALALFFVGLNSLYGMTLYSDYLDHQFGPPERTFLRFGLAVTGTVAVALVARFIYYLRRERRRAP